jgi:pimeloyl-ACP methyl ester carboxylesterase
MYKDCIFNQTIKTGCKFSEEETYAIISFGKGDPILFIAGATMTMYNWPTSIMNHTVIIFDNRGTGNTTSGTKPFSIQQFAIDTCGLYGANVDWNDFTISF